MLNTELRPLGAGEMLDRAITLYVRWFPQIVLALAVVSVPVVLLQGIVAPQSAHLWSDLGSIVAAGGGSASRRTTIATDSMIPPLAYAVIFLGTLVRVVMWTAVIAVVAGAYAGARTSLGEAYRLGLNRWFAQIVVGLAFLILGFVALIPVFVAYLLFVLALVALSALHQTVLVVVIGVIFGLLILAAFVVLGSFVFMAYELAAVAVVTETRNPVEAVRIALSRTLARGMKRRTVVGGLVLFLVSQAGALPLIAIAALATALTHVDVLYFAILGAGSVLLDGIVASFAVVYAIDARVRREGYDLLVAQSA